mgnify:CR=1 FL=1|jgi:hypothetical protein
MAHHGRAAHREGTGGTAAAAGSDMIDDGQPGGRKKYKKGRGYTHKKKKGKRVTKAQRDLGICGRKSIKGVEKAIKRFWKALSD